MNDRDWMWSPDRQAYERYNSQNERIARVYLLPGKGWQWEAAGFVKEANSSVEARQAADAALAQEAGVGE